jgi:hypothetical protein
MIYHPAQNALFAAAPSALAVCSGGDPTHFSVYKLPLSQDGSRVVGPVVCSQGVVNPGGGEEPVNWSRMPDGRLLLVLDTNSGLIEPRMLAIDPVTMSISTFASNGGYPGAALTNAGVFSTALGAAVIMDASNLGLRVYPAGSSGAGAFVPTGIGPGGNTTMFEIQPAGVSTTLKANTGTISLSAGGTQTLDFTPGAAFVGQTYWIVGSVTGWTPGLPYGGYVIPVVLDWYTDLTINSANLGPLFNNLGILSGGGASQAQLVLPAGLPPGLAGASVFHAAVALLPGVVVNHVSNPVAMRLVP